MNTTAQRIGAWAGALFTALFFLGFVIAGFIPPPDPKLPADQVAAMFQTHPVHIRIGLLIATLASALLALWTATIGVQMRRLEGGHSVLAFAQMVAGACLIMEFLFPLLVWQAAAYRTDRAPATIQTLNDLGWLPFLGIACTGVLQGIVIGVAILRDRRPNPPFPRWSGYFNIMCTFMFAPASCVVLFQDGPLAWNGLISWWLALVTFFAWIVGLTWILLGAIKHQEREQAGAKESAQESAQHTLARLEREISELRGVLGQRI
jgi:hypothetical protein